MDTPGLHGEGQLELQPLPIQGEWDGSIAYLDRDGVLNVGSEQYVKSTDEVFMLAGAGDAVAELRKAGFRICVVTNQSPIRRGVFDEEMLHRINQAVLDGLMAENPAAIVDLLLYSPYAPWEGSVIRKPGAGMLQAGRQMIAAADAGNPIASDEVVVGDAYDAQCDFDEARSFMAGDRRADMGAGWNHNVRAFWVDGEVGIAGILHRCLDTSDQGDLNSS